MSTIEKELYEIVRKAKMSAEELADLIGMSVWYLYKATTPGESGCNFPLQKLVPLMKETKDYRVLHRIAHLCGFILVKIPRTKKYDPKKLINYQHLHAEFVQKLYKLFDGKISKEECLKKANEVIDETWQIRKTVEKWDQPSLEFNGEEKK